MVKIYSKNNCTPCLMTKKRFTALGIDFQEINIDEDSQARDYVANDLGYAQSPVVVVDDNKHWSGFRVDNINKLAKK